MMQDACMFLDGPYRQIVVNLGDVATFPRVAGAAARARARSPHRCASQTARSLVVDAVAAVEYAHAARSAGVRGARDSSSGLRDGRVDRRRRCRGAPIGGSTGSGGKADNPGGGGSGNAGGGAAGDPAAAVAARAAAAPVAARAEARARAAARAEARARAAPRPEAAAVEPVRPARRSATESASRRTQSSAAPSTRSARPARAPPANGTSVCSGTLCDFTCPSGFTKATNTCISSGGGGAPSGGGGTGGLAEPAAARALQPVGHHEPVPVHVLLRDPDRQSRDLRAGDQLLRVSLTQLLRRAARAAHPFRGGTPPHH